VNDVVNLNALVSEKNLTLSVLEPDATQQSGVLKLNRGGMANVRYRVFVQPCCTPTCACCHVLFQCMDDRAERMPATPDGLRKFWLDVRAKKVVVTAELEREPESMRLAGDLAAALTPNDWERLYQWLRVSKLEIIEKASSSNVDVRRLPDSADGRMVRAAAARGYTLDGLARQVRRDDFRRFLAGWRG